MLLTCGVAMEIHYCMGKKAGMEFYGSKTDKCGKCGMAESEKAGCCHDEHQFYKIDDSHNAVFSDFNFTTPFTAILFAYPQYNCLIQGTYSVNLVNNHSPPEYSGPSACILNCVFRI
jgi:hypothetical protein